MQQDQVDVAVGAQLGTPVATHRHQRGSPRVALPGHHLLEEELHPGVDDLSSRPGTIATR